MSKADKFQQLVLDLDRCQHGRHSADPCFSCPGGQSTGNLLIPPGTLIGTSLQQRIVVPPNELRYDPEAWTVPDGEMWQSMARSAAHSQSLMRVGAAALAYELTPASVDRVAARAAYERVLLEHAQAFPE